MNVKMKINGTWQEGDVEPRVLLVHFLRDRACLTGTHVGCETSLCGACTVLVNGQSVKSCTLFAVQADGADIMTIEGLAQDGKLHPIQQGFWEEHGLQCGYCTPGMILSAYQLLERNPKPSEAEITLDVRPPKESRPLRFRRTGYQHIVKCRPVGGVPIPRGSDDR